MMRILQYKAFLRHANQAIQSLTGKKNHLALVLIDFENFSEIDSILGYRAVDTLLEEAGQRLKPVMLETDLIGYIGRHQLACLLLAPSSPGHVELAGHKMLRVLSEPYQKAAHPICLTVHIGIAMSGRQKASLDNLLRQANTAIRWAIHERQYLAIYSEKQECPKKDQFALLSDLDQAIEENRITLAYQPQLALNTNKIECAEALLRWTHPELGPILPNMMLGAAGHSEIITKITFWVFNTAMRHCAQIQKSGLEIRVSVNFSAYNLHESDLVDIVSEAMGLWEIPPTLVNIELTETDFLERHQHALKTLYQLKAMGLRISMDDFGTGYSSMELLGQLPIDEIKIDRSFVCDMLKKQKHDRIVASIIDLGHALKINVVAEGVEDIETRDRLRVLGCDLIQGDLVGRPMPLSELIQHGLSWNRC